MRSVYKEARRMRWDCSVRGSSRNDCLFSLHKLQCEIENLLDVFHNNVMKNSYISSATFSKLSFCMVNIFNLFTSKFSKNITPLNLCTVRISVQSFDLFHKSSSNLTNTSNVICRYVIMKLREFIVMQL